jgi:hypothetical protein
MSRPYSKEDDDEISLHSFDSERSGEPEEYVSIRPTVGFLTTPVRKGISNHANAKNDKKPVVKARRRIRPLSLEASPMIFKDRALDNGSCKYCSCLCNVKVFDKYYICKECTQYAVGVKLDNPKLTLIIELRKEHERLQKALNKIDRKVDMGRSVSLTVRIQDINRLLIGFINDDLDLTSL